MGVQCQSCDGTGLSLFGGACNHCTNGVRNFTNLAEEIECVDCGEEIPLTKMLAGALSHSGATEVIQCPDCGVEQVVEAMITREYYTKRTR